MVCVELKPDLQEGAEVGHDHPVGEQVCDNDEDLVELLLAGVVAYFEHPLVLVLLLELHLLIWRFLRQLVGPESSCET